MNADNMSGTPADNRGNYRKVFKPNIPTQARSEMGGAFDSGSNDSVERANTLALGLTPHSATRKPIEARSGYEPARRDVKPRGA